MKLAMISAALAVACAVPLASAGATPQERTVVRTTRVTQTSEHRRGWHNRGWRTVCRTKWRHGHRERVCRRVRWH